MRRAFLVSLAIAATVVAACREKGRPDPNIRMAVSHDPTDAEGSPGGQAGSVPTRLEVPPEVEAAYSGVKLRWKDSDGKEGVIESKGGPHA